VKDESLENIPMRPDDSSGALASFNIGRSFETIAKTYK
jgi:hypothetical protein